MTLTSSDGPANDSAATASLISVPPAGKPIVFFDGVCGFCNHTVNWILRRDAHGTFLLSPLQGIHAQQLVPAAIRENLSSVVLLIDGHCYLRSAAVCRILMLLGGVWRILGILLWLIPAPIRDLGYRIVARFRYRLFGRREACRMPTPSERSRFLD